jgi:hypothetical protein
MPLPHRLRGKVLRFANQLSDFRKIQQIFSELLLNIFGEFMLFWCGSGGLMYRAAIPVFVNLRFLNQHTNSENALFHSALKNRISFFVITLKNSVIFMSNR